MEDIVMKIRTNIFKMGRYGLITTQIAKISTYPSIQLFNDEFEDFHSEMDILIDFYNRMNTNPIKFDQDENAQMQTPQD